MPHLERNKTAIEVARAIPFGPRKPFLPMTLLAFDNAKMLSPHTASAVARSRLAFHLEADKLRTLGLIVIVEPVGQDKAQGVVFRVGLAVLEQAAQVRGSGSLFYHGRSSKADNLAEMLAQEALVVLVEA